MTSGKACILKDSEFGSCSDDLFEVFHGYAESVLVCGKHQTSRLMDAFNAHRAKLLSSGKIRLYR